jgi:hypothetical protein
MDFPNVRSKTYVINDHPSDTKPIHLQLKVTCTFAWHMAGRNRYGVFCTLPTGLIDVALTSLCGGILSVSHLSSKNISRMQGGKHAELDS